MSSLRFYNKVNRWLFVFAIGTGGASACGADTAGSSGGADAAARDTAGSNADVLNTADATFSQTLMDAMGADAPPSMTVEATTAFAEIAGNYTAKAANVSGSGTALFDNNAPYPFSIAADGTASFTTKGAAEVFTWAAHGKRIARNTKTNITVVEFEDAAKRILTITYHPSNGPFDIAGVIVDPQGRWYLTGIKKM